MRERTRREKERVNMSFKKREEFEERATGERGDEIGRERRLWRKRETVEGRESTSHFSVISFLIVIS